MKEWLLFVVKNLVTHPDRVQVTETEKDGRITLVLEVDPEDRGRVIGRQGKTANAIRTLAGASGKTVNIEIAE